MAIKTKQTRFKLTVNQLFRHGERTITQKTWPTDIYYNLSWPIGYGQLINKGKSHHYQLGQWFRRRYNGFLPSHYNATDIYVRTTDIDRTHMSAASNLAGLFRPTGWQVWNNDIQWQPIPVHTVPFNEDAVLAAGKSCAKYTSLYNNLYTSDPLLLKINEDNADLYEKIGRLTGSEVTNLFPIILIHGVTRVYESLNMFVPAWIRFYWNEITALGARYFQLYTWTSELARLQRGPFFDYILGWMDDVIDGSSTYKFLMLSAHDATVADILNTLGVFNDVPPEYASTVIWELRQNKYSNGQYINMYFKNSTHLEKLRPLGCEFNCDYEKYKTLLAPYTVDSTTWEAECTEK